MKMSNLLRTRPQDPFNVKKDINTANIDKFIAYVDKYDMEKGQRLVESTYLVKD